MGILLLKGDGHAGRRPAVRVFGDEDRIIAEAVRAFFAEGYGALPGPREEPLDAIFVDKADGGDKARISVVGAAEALEHSHSALMLGREAFVPGGIDARLAVKRLDHEAAVIRDDAALRELIDRSCFEGGIFFKSAAGLLDLDGDIFLGLRKNLKAERREDILVLRDFSFIVARYYEIHRMFEPPLLLFISCGFHVT